MEKMQAIYTNNPKLGDPNAIAQSLEQNSIKIGEIQAELDKFKVPTVDVDGVSSVFFSLFPSASFVLPLTFLPLSFVPLYMNGEFLCSLPPSLPPFLAPFLSPSLPHPSLPLSLPPSFLPPFFPSSLPPFLPP